jgi:hypothetical protein
MSKVNLINGLPFPNWGAEFLGAQTFAHGAMIMDAAGEKAAMIGRAYVHNRQSGKVVGATSTIQFRCGGVTFNDAATSLTIGLQDIDLTNTSAPGQPDGVFDVSKTLVGGGGGIAGGWNSVALDTGSKTINHGDLICVVWDMTARGGTDTVGVSPCTINSGMDPHCLTDTSGAGWATSATVTGPNVLITSNDGTLITIDGTIPFASVTQEAAADSTNPDERGLIFQVPWDCDIDALTWHGRQVTALTSDVEIALYSDPLGTPTVIAGPIASPAEIAVTISGNRRRVIPLPTPVALSKNTPYCIAVKSTNTGSVQVQGLGLPTTVDTRVLLESPQVIKATRNNSSGAFTTTANEVYPFQVRISALHDGASAAFKAAWARSSNQLLHLGALR